MQERASCLHELLHQHEPEVLQLHQHVGCAGGGVCRRCRAALMVGLFSIPFPPLCSVMVLVMIWMILLVWHEPLSPTQSDFLWARELLYDELKSQMQLDVILCIDCALSC